MTPASKLVGVFFFTCERELATLYVGPTKLFFGTISAWLARSWALRVSEKQEENPPLLDHRD
jgi:hypothetical protein